MEENIMDIVIAVIGSGALSAVISGAFTLINNRKAKKSAVSTGLQVILWDRLDYLCNKYIADGHISSTNLQRVTEMHKAYKGLGGNGYMDRLMEAVNELPIK